METDQLPSHGLQPSLMDPKMWMVKCKVGEERAVRPTPLFTIADSHIAVQPGKEREVVLQLMKRHFLKLELGQVLNITSVIAPDHTKGFVFVEGEKEPQVRAGIHGITNMFTYQMMLVPLQQMTSVLRVTSKAEEVKKGDWVRVKRGKYLGDLAQVHEVDQNGQRVEVKVRSPMCSALFSFFLPHRC